MEAFFKVPSTPADQAQGVVGGVNMLDRSLGEFESIVHGTTVGTNAIIERQGARVGLVTTTGFGDLIEIGRTQRLVPGSMFDTKFVRPKPLVPRHLRFEVHERVSADGEVIKNIETDELDALAEKINAAGVTSVAICFLHAYRNPVHEIETRNFLRRRLGSICLTISSEIVTEHREFERFSSAAVNAYLMPVMQTYLNSLVQDFKQREYHRRLYVMNSAGGMITANTAKAFPIRTILSGPAGGVNGAIHFARQADLHDIITCDMGGTSTDVCLVRNLTPFISSEHQLAGIPIKTPQMEINTVGAGGGSIAWVDAEGRLKVGPQSAGADPGPASYGRGGTHPTITDANLFLGRLGSQSLLAGRIKLHLEPAKASLERLSDRLGGYDLYQLAEGIIQIAITKMAGSIKEISVQKGHDPRDYVLIAYGGSGPMHAAQIGDELGISTILIPRAPGNLSALGLTLSDVRHDDVMHWMALLEEVSMEMLEKKFKQMEESAVLKLQNEGFENLDIALQRELDLRYRGQAFELNTPVERGDSAAQIKKRFDEKFLARYGHAHTAQAVELVNLRVASFGIVDKPFSEKVESSSGSLDEAKKNEKAVFFSGTFLDTAIFERALLPRREYLEGPAIVEEKGATTVIPPGWSAEVDDGGNIILNRRNKE
jgi:N-methylhydantoinase A